MEKLFECFLPLKSLNTDALGSLSLGYFFMGLYSKVLKAMCSGVTLGEA